MKIITIPHKTLRQPASPVVTVDKKLTRFVADLRETLAQKENPRGVGLAAPQVNTLWNIFVTQLPPDEAHDDEEDLLQQMYINPKIIDHSDQQTLGPDKRRPLLEGCLSIPDLYGPVWRWEWVQLQFSTLLGSELQEQTAYFQNFAARVIQHEYDHLQGVLFIDHSAEHGLPLYQENHKTEELVEVEPSFIEAIIAQSRP